MNESARELQQVFARLRQTGGPALAPGQTSCCYALSIDHPLLRALDMMLNAVGRFGKRRKGKETTP
jgi:hypothetical protein